MAMGGISDISQIWVNFFQNLTSIGLACVQVHRCTSFCYYTPLYNVGTTLPFKGREQAKARTFLPFGRVRSDCFDNMPPGFLAIKNLPVIQMFKPE